MSNVHNDQAWERINEDLNDHIDNYFRDSSTSKSDNELLDFLFDNKKCWETVKAYIANSKLGDKIAQEVFENLPEGPETDSRSED